MRLQERAVRNAVPGKADITDELGERRVQHPDLAVVAADELRREIRHRNLLRRAIGGGEVDARHPGAAAEERDEQLGRARSELHAARCRRKAPAPDDRSGRRVDDVDAMREAVGDQQLAGGGRRGGGGGGGARRGGGGGAPPPPPPPPPHTKRTPLNTTHGATPFYVLFLFKKKKNTH